jgi:hypothetical protein
MHEFGDRQKLHVLLHRLTAPTAVFGEAVAPEKTDASSDQNEVEECATLASVSR